MSKEREMIGVISRSMPKSPLQINGIYQCDSEIVEFNGSKLAYNIDEFSEEDLMREDDPYILGWNMAVGSLSDIYAAGAIPKFYAHSFTVKDTWNKEYVEKLSQGIADVLKKVETSFIGGDFGTAENWRYTGTVIGELKGSPLLRSNASEGDDIYITGKIGAGNIEAGLNLYSNNNVIKGLTSNIKNQFKIRNSESELIREFSRCCIDSSDGVYNALNTISEISNTGFEVGNLPYEKWGVLLTKLLRLPKEVLFLGESGEYELVFTIRKELIEEFKKRAKEENLEFYKIGEVKKYSERFLCKKNGRIDLTYFRISARDYKDKSIYLNDITKFLERSK